MPERKQRNEPLSLETSTPEGFPLEDDTIEVGSGYSIALDSKEETPVVHVKTYGVVDSIMLRRKLEQYYPGARIEGLKPKPDVKIAPKNKANHGKRKTRK